MKDNDKKIEQVVTASLVPYAKNAKKHDAAQVAAIAGSIREFGFNNPVLIDADNGIIAGHGRVLAAHQLGLERVPCLRLTHLTDTQKRAYILADNRLAELGGGWDAEMLAAELEALSAEGITMEEIGFDAAALEELGAGLGDQGNPETDAEPQIDKAEELRAKWGVEPGQLWELGDHRLLCGDSTKKQDVKRCTGGTIPDLAFCDPPYGIKAVKGGKIGGDKAFGCTGNAGGKHGFGGKGGRVHGLAKKAIIPTNVYAPIIGDDSTKTAVNSYNLCAELKIPHLIFWGGNYYADQLPPSRCWIAWDKEVTGSFADIELAWTNLDQVARLLRHQWSGLMKASERGEGRVHPTQKPSYLLKWVFKEMLPETKTVLDQFIGSGSTIMACEQANRKCFGIEMSPAYVAVALQRWADATGKTPKLVA
jgi:hypothetical protein